MAFLEERISEQFSFGSAVDEMFSVDITEVENGNEYSRLRHPYPKLMIDLQFTSRTETVLYDTIIDFWKRSAGRHGGFRWKHPSDYSTNDYNGTPAYNDQACVIDPEGSGSYQAIRWYGTESGSESIRRRLKKIVSGTMLVGIRDESANDHQIIATGVSPERWTVDENTGLITFRSNVSYAITNITQAAQAEITIGAHTLVANESVHVSAVSGMTEINGLRGVVQSVTATTIVVDINSSGFSAFSSASPLGVVNTSPQSNETVTCGCQFDIPVRFETDLSGLIFRTKNSSDTLLGLSIQLIEKLNP